MDGNIDYFIAGMGTTGTLMGVCRFLREKNGSDTRIIGVEPSLGHSIQGLKNMSEAIRPKIYNSEILDEVITVPDNEAFTVVRDLTTKEGLFVGMSSGAGVYGSLKLAEKITSGTIVTILPDRGDRYLSTNLFRSFCGKCPP